MRLPLRVPISAKLSIVSILMLVIAMVPTAFKTSSLFKNVSGKREEDSNRAQADARASETGVALDKTVDKIILYGLFLSREHAARTSATAAVAVAGDRTADGAAESAQPSSLAIEMLAKDADIVSLSVYGKELGQSTKLLDERINEAFLAANKLDSGFIRRVGKARPFPVDQVFAGEILVRNSSTPGNPPLLSMGVPLAKDALGKVSHVAVAHIRMSTIQKAFSESGERAVFLVDSKGTVFAHPDEKLATGRVNLSKLGIVSHAIASKIGKGQLRYTRKDTKQTYIAAFSKIRFGLIVVSEAPESIILEPAAHVQRQVFFITGLVLSGALLIVFLLSLTITRPIEKLVVVTKQIARGNFGLHVARLVPSNDEVGTLAVSFDAMLAGLRERDRVKNLFSKFHGSSVAESLLASDKVETGGVRKHVVVFFSDIRGFTSISETSSPEQVVAMVNEYFSIMVRIILSKHGIVDKFIGDAIMAIWGAPKSTGSDSVHALAACLEMRKALADLNAKRIGRGEKPLNIGMGLHAGEAISGNIGSEERMEFTVIGDTVNMASRIEASTKAFGSDLLVSESVAEEVKGKFILDVVGTVKVKGKAEPLKLFKVLGSIDATGMEHIVKTPYSDYEAADADKVEVV